MYVNLKHHYFYLCLILYSNLQLMIEKIIKASEKRKLLVLNIAILILNLIKEIV